MSEAENTEMELESADTMKIISKLWLLSTKTENIEILIDKSENLWSPEEKIFLIHLPDRILKCNAFYSKIIQRDDPSDKVKLIKALRNSDNNFIADEILLSENQLNELPESSLDKEEEESSLSQQAEEEELALDSLNNMKVDETFTSVQLRPKTQYSPSPLTSITYEVNGARLKKPSNILDFGFKCSLEKILEPRQVFLSESYYQRITVLKLSDFIINQSHLIQALQPCEVIQVLEMNNVFFDSSIKLTNSKETKLWIPKLKKFTFHAEKYSSINLQYTTESYSWDYIFFFETNKRTPTNLRNLCQGIDISVKTLSMQVEINQESSSVLFKLFKRQWNGVPFISDYFLDSFFENCRRIQSLEIILPEMTAKLPFDSLSQQLKDLTLSGFVLVGSFSSMKPIQNLVLCNCTLPNIFLDELHGILPHAQSIQLLNCLQEDPVGSTTSYLINIKILST